MRNPDEAPPKFESADSAASTDGASIQAARDGRAAVTGLPVRKTVLRRCSRRSRLPQTRTLRVGRDEHASPLAAERPAPAGNARSACRCQPHAVNLNMQQRGAS